MSLNLPLTVKGLEELFLMVPSNQLSNILPDIKGTKD